MDVYLLKRLVWGYKGINRLGGAFTALSIFTGNDTSAEHLDGADSDGEGVSAPVKRRRKMVLIDEDEEED